ncbi:hypothetical protein CGMCC3_g17845 [Colletotrichum fructicola]|uniref:Uncharacterized protein n=1 Tax=Colletotrichum fructicola (strain Nara gc5) TaxID=1213859 RepID=A0A7J6IMD6_COLFN|nr:uncharacterized protein CGMCC3_g17845 [Colletotrichum fructicola]KAF4477883.1 hypothetical protein CGGC5_v013037 [Colletotrichum fructicola Nara gc5]KAE9565976.1 hypothetical protein CGMCC3_g17845 [Colletotrichum fructicola]KAF4428715.1 hypothetical protein CFRS1_v007719 [Colletotrichum fructicola]KAF4481488.1 hypothetical protein CGGC5_v010282 [Colletotrichum fructicola Nara gc5]KAF4881481.1 hypothetical protein CGCFRS4_v015516 [Colletotrichum fructicola]
MEGDHPHNRRENSHYRHAAVAAPHGPAVALSGGRMHFPIPVNISRMPLDTPTYVLEDQFEPVVYEILEAALTSVNKPSTDPWPSVWAVPRRTLFRLLKNTELLQHKLEAHGLGEHHESKPFVPLIPLSTNIYEWAQKEAETARGKSCHVFAITSVLHAAKPNAWGPEVLRVAASGKGGTVYPSWARGTAVDPLCIDQDEGDRIV